MSKVRFNVAGTFQFVGAHEKPGADEEHKPFSLSALGIPVA